MPILNWLKSAYSKYHQQTFLTVFANFLWVQNRVKFCVFWHPSRDSKKKYFINMKKKKTLLTLYGMKTYFIYVH